MLRSHCGSIAAMPRAYSRVVSTSSAATIQRPGFFVRCAPGMTPELMPRAPRYDSSSSLLTPMLPSRPASIARCSCS